MTQRKTDVSKKPSKMAAMFSSIAEKYDRTNLIISLGLCKMWNHSLVKKILIKIPRDYLDLCCGTGEIALKVLEAIEREKKPLPCTQLVDVAPKMLELCQQRLIRFKDAATLTFLQQDAHELKLEENSLDLITIAYGVRNLQNPEQVIDILQKSLKKGGKLIILELSQPRSYVLRFFHALYLRFLLPILGWLGSSRRLPYHYLQCSIEGFISPKKLAQILTHSGFSESKLSQLSFGCAFILEGIK